MVTNFPSALTVQDEGCAPQKNLPDFHDAVHLIPSPFPPYAAKVTRRFLIVKNMPFVEQARPTDSEHLCNLRVCHCFSVPFFALVCALQSHSPLTLTPRETQRQEGGAAGRTRRQRCSCQGTSISGHSRCTVMQDLHSGGAFVSGVPGKPLPSGSVAAASGPPPEHRQRPGPAASAV